MNPLKRLLHFNLVGLLGIFVQLTTLAIFNRTIPQHYLLTSTLAIELTLLHNFAWHIRYTWPQASPHNTLRRLLRFHLSNGLISLLGNLALMPIFIKAAHTPVVLANALTITSCGLANFLLAHRFVFSQESLTPPLQNPPARMRVPYTAPQRTKAI
jgi:putative flippase GtrA